MGRGIIARILALLVAALAPCMALAEPVRLKVAPEIEATGIVRYLLPRFSLKTGVRVEIAEPAEVEIGTEGAALMEGAGALWRLRLGSGRAEAVRFHDWLISDIGLRTIYAYEVDGAQVFQAPRIEEAAVEIEIPEGDADLGEALALRHCGRCHVVSKANRFAGIGSTPSFMALRTMPDWLDRFRVFWTLNPHPSFTQVEGITPDFDPLRPPHIAPVEMTMEEVEGILAFVATIAPADLGAAVDAR